MMTEKNYTDILKKLFSYEYSEKELQQLLDNLNTEDEKQHFFAEAMRLWSASKESKSQLPVDSEKSFGQVLSKIKQAEENNKLKPAIVFKKIAGHLNIQWFIKIAAVFILGTLLFVAGRSLLHSPNRKGEICVTVKVPLGTKQIIVLPDNTKVWINAGSTLNYPKHFGTLRTVHLTGEAYFEVTKDARHPFIVSTPLMNVKVLGTGFDVSAYPGDNQVKTTLVHGKVLVYQVNKDGLVKEKAILLPGEQSVFRVAGKTFSVKKVNTKNYTAWRNGKLTFKDTPLPEVIKQIDRWYNVKIFVYDKVIEHFDYTVQFDNDSLDCVLKVLQEITPIRITRSGRKIFVTRDKTRWNDFLRTINK